MGYLRKLIQASQKKIFCVRKKLRSLNKNNTFCVVEKKIICVVEKKEEFCDVRNVFFCVVEKKKYSIM